MNHSYGVNEENNTIGTTSSEMRVKIKMNRKQFNEIFPRSKMNMWFTYRSESSSSSLVFRMPYRELREPFNLKFFGRLYWNFISLNKMNRQQCYQILWNDNIIVYRSLQCITMQCITSNKLNLVCWNHNHSLIQIYFNYTLCTSFPIIKITFYGQNFWTACVFE